jgi:pyruvate dehydrogenase E1 component alpha subunit
MNISNDLLLDFFEKMYIIRNFELKILDYADRGLVFGAVHLCIGEEATAVGTGMNLRKEDYVIITHRGHGQAIVKGSNIKKLMAEILGKTPGLCKGRAGSIHIVDMSVNNLGALGSIIGASFPISIGVGLGLKLKNMDAILMSYCGDGATNQGAFYESLNFADLWQLPIIFICVNNLYGMGTSYSRTSNIEIYKKAQSFNMPSIVADGNDVVEVYLRTKQLLDIVKKERKPAFIELRTYRWIGHSSFDKHTYRSKEEVEQWKKLDPIKRLEEKLLVKDDKNKDRIELLKIKADTILFEAEKFVLESNYPDYDESLEQ